MKPASRVLLLFVCLILLVASTTGLTQDVRIPIPRIELGIGEAQNPNDLAITLEILFLLTILTLAPSILLMFTSFTRLVIVLGVVRGAIGTRQTPPNQVIVAVALFLTFFTMQPTFNKVWNQAWVPYSENRITYQTMFERTGDIFKDFMVAQLKIHKNEDNVDMLMESTGRGKVEAIEKAGLDIIIPAFVIGELEIAFKMSILLYIPFIVVDMLVASILMAMGMIMIPPALISMPFKILLFIAVNGWDLIVMGLIRSF
ncbi:MAG TPA: flagellar type III secretion system pore protein FliP [Thermotogota bacterium]|jgi:flagellar biosynthetic protein FliP|nr:flagellar type III secretion system pore protein FliP [Thermotogota bacterium]NLH19354.1 flagellar type III secretion system pore protein FliP [Thermotogaceae bacterium]OQC32292.1 MAG: Flagellar biosynthetic protein FliP precursor [Thermotogota bacterium ADurb.Bin062]HNW46076.1 flagellar type III secretion system pore protein FliP [Thermotogota bacterium]HOD90507.1 flagellar type III secretion system pore protein FliP [Thermotogota bacterium]